MKRDSKDKNEELIIVLLDAKSAFDVVEPDHLLRRLYHIGVNDKTWSIIQSLHEDASSAIKWNGHISEFFKINQGVRQGGILSADLYKVYVNPLLNRINRTGIGAKIGNIICNTSACADDVTVNATNIEDTQILLNIAEDFAKQERYQLQPTKTNALKIQFSRRQQIETCEQQLQMKGQNIPNAKEATHIGLIQTDTFHQTTDRNVDNNIKKARRATYSLLASGLHGHNGLDPETSLQLIRIYILPILLYGLEMLLPNRTLINKLELFQKKLLKQVLSLPQNTSDSAIYLLTGFLPIEAQIHKKALLYFNNISNQKEESIEKKLARRQLSVKPNSSHSWFIEIKKILIKYDCQDPVYLLDNQISKNEWKSLIQKKINLHWWNNIKHQASLYKSLQFLTTNKCYAGKIHPLLQISCKSKRDVNRIPVKLKILTGTYILQTNRAKYKNYTVDSTCVLCDTEDETLEHFILHCPTLAVIRDPIFVEIQHILQQNHKVDFNNLTVEEKLQTILDCTSLIPNKRNTDSLDKLEFQTRRLLHNMHTARYKMLLNAKDN